MTRIYISDKAAFSAGADTEAYIVGVGISESSSVLSGKSADNTGAGVVYCDIADIASEEPSAVSHESGTAVVTLTAPVEDDTLRRTVEDKGYTVTAIR